MNSVLGPTRISPETLASRLGADDSLVILDVRRASAFDNKPVSLPNAIPLVLDVDQPRIPDLPLALPIVILCLCAGEASSTRVSLWMRNAGYSNVSVLVGGLPAWEQAGLPVEPIRPVDSAMKWRAAPLSSASCSVHQAGTATQPMLAEVSFLAGEELPVRRDLAVLFVDMVDSTPLLFEHSNERVLELVQAFMTEVVDVAVHHCGDVHDFEGDGAMLYFAGSGEALPAAFRLRDELAAARQKEPRIPAARFSVDAGPVVIGHIGTRFRRSLSFIGPCVNRAARILKYAPPNSIAITRAVHEHALRSEPDLASLFGSEPQRQRLKGFGDESIDIYIST